MSCTLRTRTEQRRGAGARRMECIHTLTDPLYSGLLYDLHFLALGLEHYPLQWFCEPARLLGFPRQRKKISGNVIDVVDK